MKSKVKIAAKSLVRIEQSLTELVETLRGIRHDLRALPIEMRLREATRGHNRAATNVGQKKKVLMRRGPKGR